MSKHVSFVSCPLLQVIVAAALVALVAADGPPAYAPAPYAAEPAYPDIAPSYNVSIMSRQ